MYHKLLNQWYCWFIDSWIYHCFVNSRNSDGDGHVVHALIVSARVSCRWYCNVRTLSSSSHAPHAAHAFMTPRALIIRACPRMGWRASSSFTLFLHMYIHHESWRWPENAREKTWWAYFNTYIHIYIYVYFLNAGFEVINSNNPQSQIPFCTVPGPRNACVATARMTSIQALVDPNFDQRPGIFNTAVDPIQEQFDAWIARRVASLLCVLTL